MRLVTKSYIETLESVRHYSERAMFCRCRRLRTIPVKEYSHDGEGRPNNIIPLVSLASDDIAIPRCKERRESVPIHQLDDAMDRFVEQAPNEFSATDIIIYFDSLGLEAPHNQIYRYIRDGAGGSIQFIGFKGPRKLYSRA